MLLSWLLPALLFDTGCVVICCAFEQKRFSMCQVGPDYSGSLEAPHSPSISKVCVKCKVNAAAVLIRAGDAYCRGCFREYFIHKFRAMLGKNRIIFPGEKVLLAVSGGPSSCSMLSQVQEGLSENAHKKLRFTPGIVFIDEGAVSGHTVEDRRKTVTELKALFETTGFPFHIIPLEQILELPPSVLMKPPYACSSSRTLYKAAVSDFVQREQISFEPHSQEHSPADFQEAHTLRLQRLMASVNTQTAQEELLSTFRQHLLLHTARTEGYSKLMLGDNCTRLAVKLLSSISLGRGAQAAQDTGFSDSRSRDITAVRPMRDYSVKEIAYYSQLFHVPSVFVPNFKTSDKASIQRLTESFVTKLQAEFPSTVSTIYRTSDKLQTACKSSSAVDSSPRCLLCMCTLDTQAGEYASAFQATLISEQLSENKPPENRCTPALQHSPGKPQCSAAHCSGEATEGGGCCSSASRPELQELKVLLCYSCQLTIKDMSSVEHLPSYIISEATRRLRRSQMRAEISEFLLDESE